MKTTIKYEKKSVVQDESVHDGFVIGAFGIMLLIFANVILLWASTTIVASFSLYHRWLESIAWITGFGSIIHAIGIVFHGRARQKISSILFGIAAIIGLFLILYIDYFRPDLTIAGIFNDAVQFNAFKMNIAILETFMIGLSFVGIIVTRARINK